MDQDWMSVAQEFLEKWNFNNCLGAIDGKHVLIRPPPNSGSYYFNESTEVQTLGTI